jgi:hypothetical protein
MYWFAIGGLIVLTLVWVDRMLHPRQPRPLHPVRDYAACFIFGVIVFGSPMWLLFGS